MKPESLMMSHGYRPEWSEGAIKCPNYQTSTFVFRSAEEGKSWFEMAYGLRAPKETEQQGLIYSRINNPSLQILEERLCLWDKAEQAAVFESGMSAISTTFLEFLKPGSLLLHSTPTYGGSSHFIDQILPKFGIQTLAFDANDDFETIVEMLEATGKADQLSLIFTETPANPTLALIDLEMCRRIADRYSNENRVTLAVDNTLMGPLWSHPLEHGADIVLYSATKYIGGHSDLIAGAALGSNELIGRMKVMRTFLGNMAAPNTGWLLMRSLETLKVRMECQANNAEKVAEFLMNHDQVEKVYYLGNIEAGTRQDTIRKKQYNSNGALLSFDIKGGEKEAFCFLNSLKLIRLAVSLGSTESLVEHPATMTHIDVPADVRKRHAISEKLIRLSVGVEDPQDLIDDLAQAFELVTALKDCPEIPIAGPVVNLQE